MALIFFDYDGVLVDSLEVETKNFRAACHQVGVEAVETTEDMARLSEGNFYEGLDALGIPREKILEAIEIYNKDKKNNPDFQVEVHKPILKLLNKLAKKYPLYIVTSNTSDTVKRVLSEYGVDKVRGVLGADEETSKVKKLHSIMELYPGEKTLFVGDTKGDMVEAAAAGVDVRIGVTWGWQKPWVVASGNPNYIFDDFKLFRTWFKGFIKGTK